MRALLICAVLVLVTMTTGCPTPDPDYPYAKEPVPINKEITLAAGDALEIRVWENKDLNADVRVRPDGFITVPLAGDIKAVGLTPTELKQAIAVKLQDFIKLQGTEITVSVVEWKGYRFTVQGEVVRQGVFSSDAYLRVGEALAMAGGLTRFAKRNDIRVLRTDPKTRQVRQIPIVYDLLVAGKRLDMDIYILPGDVITVP